jgi:signal transduction histidine kinase
MMSEKIDTLFAPAEREPPEKVLIQYRRLLGYDFSWQLLDAVPDIFLILNDKRQIVFTNKMLPESLGYQDPRDVLGLRPGEAVACVHATEMPGGCGTSEFCRNCGAVRAILSSLRGEELIDECRILRENGQALDLRVWATPMQVDGERFSTFAIQDISHEKRRRVLERAFFHDLLNIAGGLQGFVELLRESPPDKIEEPREWIYAISQHLIEEINAQKQLAAAENNELSVRPAPVQSLKFLREVVETYKNHDVAEDRVIAIDPRAQNVWFVSDLRLLRRIIGNMLKNALEAINVGETVTLSCQSDEEGVRFTVHNPGFIPRDVQLQIFQRSFSTKGNGRGIGTYSMKLLSERYLGGEVSFTTSPEGGTLFWARYPAMLKA